MRGLFKVLNGNERNLSAAESQAIVKFKIPMQEDQKEPEANQNELDQNLSYAEKLLAMKRKQPSDNSVSSSVYSSMEWIIPTQVECERLFSECKYVLTQERGGMDPYSFEMALFLKKHYQLWDQILVSKLVHNHGRREDDVADAPAEFPQIF